MRLLPIQTLGATCHPSPCERLSRPRDYYDGSVTLRLAPCRSSRVSIGLDVSARFYGVLLSILGFITRSPSPRAFQRFDKHRCFGSRGELLPMAMSPFRMCYGGPREGHTWTRIRHYSVSPCAQDLRAERPYTSSGLPALTPCYTPLWVSPLDKVPVLKVSLSTSLVLITRI